MDTGSAYSLKKCFSNVLTKCPTLVTLWPFTGISKTLESSAFLRDCFMPSIPAAPESLWNINKFRVNIRYSLRSHCSHFLRAELRIFLNHWTLTAVNELQSSLLRTLNKEARAILQGHILNHSWASWV